MAAKRIHRLVKRYDESIEVLVQLDTVKSCVEWFQQNSSYDLIFMDIQLADGMSFEIFEKVEVKSPVIFTTAFDQYAIKAFKVNSIDYLLKPIDFEELTNAIDKFKNNLKQPAIKESLKEIARMLQEDSFKERFVIKVGEHIKSLSTSDIQCFYSFEKATYINTIANKNYVIDYSLDVIEKLVSGKLFFRVNRKYIISINSIVDIISYSNSRLKISLYNQTLDEIIVSREKVQKFKQWLDR